MIGGNSKIAQLYAPRGVASVTVSELDRVGRSTGGARRAAKRALVLGIAGFLALAIVVHVGWTSSWDEEALSRLGVGSKDEMNLVYYLSLAVPAVGGLAAAVCAALRRFKDALLWALVVGGLLGADPVLKLLFRRPALSGVTGDYSFPSGSAMVSLGVVLALVLSTRGIARVASAIVGAAAVVLFGGMIVLARWHYPTDVLAGWCVATSWSASMWLLVSAVRPLRKER